MIRVQPINVSPCAIQWIVIYFAYPPKALLITRERVVATSGDDTLQSSPSVVPYSGYNSRV